MIVNEAEVASSKDKEDPMHQDKQTWQLVLAKAQGQMRQARSGPCGGQMGTWGQLLLESGAGSAEVSDIFLCTMVW